MTWVAALGFAAALVVACESPSAAHCKVPVKPLTAHLPRDSIIDWASALKADPHVQPTLRSVFPACSPWIASGKELHVGDAEAATFSMFRARAGPGRHAFRPGRRGGNRAILRNATCAASTGHTKEYSAVNPMQLLDCNCTQDS